MDERSETPAVGIEPAAESTLGLETTAAAGTTLLDDPARKTRKVLISSEKEEEEEEGDDEEEEEAWKGEGPDDDGWGGGDAKGGGRFSRLNVAQNIRRTIAEDLLWTLRTVSRLDELVLQHYIRTFAGTCMFACRFVAIEVLTSDVVIRGIVPW